MGAWSLLRPVQPPWVLAPHGRTCTPTQVRTLVTARPQRCLMALERCRLSCAYLCLRSCRHGVRTARSLPLMHASLPFWRLSAASRPLMSRSPFAARLVRCIRRHGRIEIARQLREKTTYISMSMTQPRERSLPITSKPMRPVRPAEQNVASTLSGELCSRAVGELRTWLQRPLESGLWRPLRGSSAGTAR